MGNIGICSTSTVNEMEADETGGRRLTLSPRVPTASHRPGIGYSHLASIAAGVIDLLRW